MRSVQCIVAGMAIALSFSGSAVGTAAEGVSELQTVAKKAKRSFGRTIAKRSAAPPAETGEPIPLPRAKGEGKSDVVAPAPRPTPVAAAEAEPAAAPSKDIPNSPVEARSQLRSYYAVSVLADRCGFPVTTKEGNSLDRFVGKLEQVLKLSEQQADALYAEVDSTLYSKGGGKMCLQEGDQARSFRATLETLR